MAEFRDWCPAPNYNSGGRANSANPADSHGLNPQELAIQKRGQQFANEIAHRAHMPAPLVIYDRTAEPQNAMFIYDPNKPKHAQQIIVIGQDSDKKLSELLQIYMAHEMGHLYNLQHDDLNKQIAPILRGLHNIQGPRHLTYSQWSEVAADAFAAKQLYRGMPHLPESFLNILQTASGDIGDCFHPPGPARVNAQTAIWKALFHQPATRAAAH